MIEFGGLDELAKKLEDLGQKAEDLHGEHELPVSELLTPAFLAKCSQFISVDDLFAASDFKVETPEDFKAIPDDQWDDFIRKNTSYESWNAMLTDAASEWTAKKLGLSGEEE